MPYELGYHRSSVSYQTVLICNCPRLY